MVDLIDEIRDDLNKERMQRYWSRYGLWVIVAAALVIVATAVNVFWNNRIARQNEALGRQYYTAMELLRDGKQNEAVPIFDALEHSDSKAYPALAALKKASILQKSNDIDGAIAAYKSIAKQKSDPALSQLAALLSVQLAMEHGKADDASIAKTLETLSKPNGVWRYSAQEWQAAHALAQGNKDKATEIYVRLQADPLTPQSIRNRAEEMLASLGGDKPVVMSDAKHKK